MQDIHNGKYTFFWNGPFSQWFKSDFNVEFFDLGDFYRHKGGTFRTAEQFMMYAKAIMFNDKEIATQIMATNDPSKQKALGRQVKNFDVTRWNAIAQHIVFQGNLAKFTQNEALLADLKATKGTILVEASPYDTIWGIGLNEETARITPVKDWKGTNWLGIALEKVKHHLTMVESLTS